MPVLFFLWSTKFSTLVSKSATSQTLGRYPQSYSLLLPKPNKSNYLRHKSYRPISLLPNLSKLLEKLLSGKIYSHIKNIISPNQHGFVQGRSTISALSDIVSTAIHYKQTNLVAIVAIDISSAFDCAWRPTILKAMDVANLPAELIKIIVSYFQNRQVHFHYSNFSVSKIPSLGCPQGGALSPLLWTILINDLPISYNISNSTIIAYADDVTIIIWAPNADDLKLTISRCLESVETEPDGDNASEKRTPHARDQR